MSELAVASLRQINLYNPSLLPVREVFSARLIVTWVVIAALAMAAVGWWALLEKRNVSREVAIQLSQQAAINARSTVVGADGAALPTPQQVAAIRESLRSKHALLETRRATRDLLTRGLASEKAGPTALMRLIATTVPPQLWLTELRVNGKQVTIAGKTLEPSAVNLWLDRLRASGYLIETPMPTMRVEQLASAVPAVPGVPLVYTFNIAAGLASPFADEGATP